MVESQKKYDIEENTGEFTRLVIENKIKAFDFEPEEAVAMLTDSEIEHAFSESIKSFIIKCGFKYSMPEKKDSILEMKRFICRKLADIGEPQIVSEKTVGRWLKGESKPDYSFNSRETMFVLMFAMGANLEMTNDFFLKAYYAQPFNFRNQNECIYYWCLKNNKDWEKVKELKKKLFEEQSKNVEIKSFADKTILIGKALDELLTEEELITYIANNISPDETYFNSAKQLFEDCLNEAKEIAELKYDEMQSEINAERKNNKLLSQSDDAGLAENDYLENLAYRRQKDSVDFLLSVIFDTRKAIKPDKKWNFHIKENFPNKEQISRCFKGDASNMDLLRKSMILLMFFIVYGNDDNQEFDDFYSNVNYQLEQCGFPLLYPANPYDRIFLSCAYYGTSAEAYGFTPLECFRSIFYTEE